MLREFEDRRNNSYDWRGKEKRASSQPPTSQSKLSSGNGLKTEESARAATSIRKSLDSDQGL